MYIRAGCLLNRFKLDLTSATGNKGWREVIVGCSEAFARTVGLRAGEIDKRALGIGVREDRNVQL